MVYEWLSNLVSPRLMTTISVQQRVQLYNSNAIVDRALIQVTRKIRGSKKKSPFAALLSRDHNLGCAEQRVTDRTLFNARTTRWVRTSHS